MVSAGVGECGVGWCRIVWHQADGVRRRVHKKYRVP